MLLAQTEYCAACAAMCVVGDAKDHYSRSITQNFTDLTSHIKNKPENIETLLVSLPKKRNILTLRLPNGMMVTDA